MATQKTSKGKGLYLHARSIWWRRKTLEGGPKGGGKEELGEEE